MNCPNCGSELPDRAKFCLDCGTNLTKITTVETDIKENDNKVTDEIINNEELPIKTDKNINEYKNLETVIFEQDDIKYTKTKNIVNSILFILLACCIGAGLYLGYDYYIKSKPIDNKIIKSSSGEIEEWKDSNGNKIFRFTLYISDGSTLALSSLPYTKNIEVDKSGTTLIDIPESKLISIIPSSSETKKIKFKARIKKSNGTYETIHLAEELTLVYPTCNLKIILPEEINLSNEMTVYNDDINFRFKIEKDFKLSIDNIEYTADEYGIVTYNKILNSVDNKITLSVQRPGFVDYNKIITINKPENPFPIQINSVSAPVLVIESGKHPLVPDSEITIMGKTEPSAVLNIVPAPKNVFIDPQTGEFKAIMTMTWYGSVNVSISATMDDKTSRIDKIITYSPDLNYYTTHAQAFTPKLISNPEAHAHITFQFLNVKVESVLETEDKFIFLGSLVGVENSQLAFEYSNPKKITVGSTYKIFADVYGKYTLADQSASYPHLIARFVTKVN